MAAQIFSIFAFSRPKVVDWSQQELAEFYRVENALVQAGMQVEVDRGITDEGDPWFVFCRQGDGEVIIHFARLDGRYIVSSPAYSGTASGEDFGELARDLVSHHPLVCSGKRNGAERTNVFLHPTALLIALVATAFFKSGEASAHSADELSSSGNEDRKSWVGSSLPLLGGASSVNVTLDARHIAVVISAAIFSLTQSETIAPETNSSLTFTHFVGSDETAQTHGSDHTSTLIDLAVLDSVNDHFQISGINQIGHNDVLNLLSVVAVLTDLPGDRPRVVFDSHSGVSKADTSLFEDFGNDQTLNGSHRDGSSASYEKSPVTLELVKGAGDYPAVHTFETTSGDKVQSHDLVQALPQFLQPFLADSMHLITKQGSDGILLSINLHEANGLLADANASHTPTAIAPVVPTFQQAVSSPSEDTAGASGLLAGDKGAVVGLIEKFIDHTPDFKVLTVDHNVIFYDPHAISAGDLSLRSMTWDFADGISISLVAPTSNFPSALFVA